VDCPLELLRNLENRWRFRLLLALKRGHDGVMPSPQQLRDLYRFPGFVPLACVQVAARDAQAVLLTLRRRRKKRPAAYVASGSPASTTNGPAKSVTSPVVIGGSTCLSRCAASTVGAVAA
jgi:hypothetical protein